MKKLIRLTTIPQSLNGLLKGQLRFMNNYFDVHAISSGGGSLEKFSIDEGIKVLPVLMTRTISPIKDLTALFNLYILFKREKPFIVHTHTPKAGTLGMIAAFLARVPHRLHTVAGLPLIVVKGKKRKLLDFVEKITYSCATKIYPNSLGLYNIILANNYTSKNKMKVIGNGSSNGIDIKYFDPKSVIPEQRFELKNELKITHDDFVFIFVGRLVKDKGIQELVEAFLKLNTIYNKSKLLLVGQFEKNLDPLDEKIEYEIINNNSILHVGYRQDVRPYLAISNVLTFPSYREGFPNVVMQAGAMGLPSIVTNINGCNEIIKDGINGYIIPVANIERLFEKMKLLFSNREITQQLASTAREFICQNYERKFVWNEILKEYTSLEN